MICALTNIVAYNFGTFLLLALAVDELVKVISSVVFYSSPKCSELQFCLTDVISVKRMSGYE